MKISSRYKSLLLALLLSINSVGCSTHKKNSSEIDYINNTVFSSTLDSLLNKKEYLKLCDSVISKYNYEELYITPSEIQYVIDSTEEKFSCNNTNTNIYNLIETIQKNTEDYLNKKDDIYNAFDIGNINERVDSNLFKHSVIRAIISCLEDDESLFEENYCKMSQIKIVVDNSISVQGCFVLETQYDDDYELVDNNTMFISLDNILKDYDRAKDSYNKYPTLYEDPKDFYYYLENFVLAHEFNHVKQSICSCRENSGEKNSSMQIIFPCDSSPSGLDTIGKMLIESSAESKLYADELDQSKEDSYTYETYRKKEALLFLLSLYEKKAVSEYYNSINNTDFASFYDFFSLDNDDKKADFYKILYSFEASEFTNYFMSKYDSNIKTIKYAELKDMVGDAVYIDLYKMFVKNSIEYGTSDCSLEEKIFLHDIGKLIILGSCYSDLIKGNDGYKFIYDSQIRKSFKELGDIYYEYICRLHNTTMDEICDIKTKNQILITDFCHNSIYNEKCNVLLSRYPVLSNIRFSLNLNPLILKSFDESVKIEALNPKIYAKRLKEVKNNCKDY